MAVASGSARALHLPVWPGSRQIRICRGRSVSICSDSFLLEGVDPPKSLFHAFMPTAAMTSRSDSH